MRGRGAYLRRDLNEDDYIKVGSIWVPVTRLQFANHSFSSWLPNCLTICFRQLMSIYNNINIIEWVFPKQKNMKWHVSLCYVYASGSNIPNFNLLTHFSFWRKWNFKAKWCHRESRIYNVLLFFPCFGLLEFMSTAKWTELVD